MQHTIEEFSMRVTTLFQTSSQSKVCRQSCGCPKVEEVLTLGILGLPLRSPGRKCHLGAGPMARHRIYYKEEGGGFPQIQAVMSSMSLSLLMVRPSIKSAQSMH